MTGPNEALTGTADEVVLTGTDTFNTGNIADRARRLLHVQSVGRKELLRPYDVTLSGRVDGWIARAGLEGPDG